MLIQGAPYLEDFDGLFEGDGPCEELDQVPGLDDDVGIVSFSRRLHRHRAFDNVELGLDFVLVPKRLSDQRPTIAKIFLPIINDTRLLKIIQGKYFTGCIVNLFPALGQQCRELKLKGS